MAGRIEAKNDGGVFNQVEGTFDNLSQRMILGDQSALSLMGELFGFVGQDSRRSLPKLEQLRSEKPKARRFLATFAITELFLERYWCDFLDYGCVNPQGCEEEFSIITMGLGNFIRENGFGPGRQDMDSMEEFDKIMEAFGSLVKKLNSV